MKHVLKNRSDNRIIISSGSQWEPVVGYSRAFRVHNVIYVSGTTSINPAGDVVGVNNPYLQSLTILELIEKALNEAGGDIRDVVRTRIYVTDIEHWQDVGKAHAEVFGEVMPATSMVEVSGLIHPEMLVEIEAVAVVAEDDQVIE